MLSGLKKTINESVEVKSINEERKEQYFEKVKNNTNTEDEDY